MRDLTWRVLTLLSIATFGIAGDPAAPPLDDALARLSRSLAFQTVSRPGTEQADHGEFERFHAFLEQEFPAVHRHLQRQKIGVSSLLYRWSGSRPDLRPIVLLAHQDVVAVDEATREQWQHPPFSGVVADGFVWGRGARDFKPGLMAILESVEWLLGRGFQPERTVYLAFGDDEEVRGFAGAARIAEHLHSAGVEAELVLDEGGGVTMGMVGGIDPQRHVALVSVAEKGYLTVELQVEGPGGHSSSPGRENPVVTLSNAVSRLERSPFPARLREPVTGMLKVLGPEMSAPRRLAFANLWLTGALVTRSMLASPEAASMLRTTVAFTRFESGVQENVIPTRARAVANLRLLPGCTVAEALRHLAESIDDPRVKVTVLGRSWEAPAVAPHDTSAYQVVESAIEATFPDALVVPSITSGATDARHYASLTGNLYRFAPSVSTREFSGNGHAVDERLPVDNYRNYLDFYTTFIRLAAGCLKGAVDTAAPGR